MREIEITGDELMEDLPAKLEAIRQGTVFLVRATASEGTILPSGLCDEDGSVAFVIGPPNICDARGLYDEEYGWPKDIRLEEVKSLSDLSPGHRAHPVLTDGTSTIAASVMIAEWQEIRKRRDA